MIETPNTQNFKLGIENFTYRDLYCTKALARLAKEFYVMLEEDDIELSRAFNIYREAQGKGFAPKDEADLIIRTAPYLEKFLAKLFFLEDEIEKISASAKSEDDIFIFKKEFVQRRVLKRSAESLDENCTFEKFHKFAQALLISSFEIRGNTELDTAHAVASLLKWSKAYEKFLNKKTELDEQIQHSVTELYKNLSQNKITYAHAKEILSSSMGQPEVQKTFVDFLLEQFEIWLFLAANNPEGKNFISGWVSFDQPHVLDYENLVQLSRPSSELPELMAGPAEHLRFRDGFSLTDTRGSKREIHSETDYCLYCHLREKDSCSHGFVEKDGSYRKNPLGISLQGCPLDEKISEAHFLHRSGNTIGALATIVIDNPMVPGTGHRICNDCMKSCIFQKQTPVDIPQAETGILSEVLNLPYGFEIYSLLTRWNPLNVKRPIALPYNGKNILVVGLGPAGYTLAHYLLNEGFGVVGIDGLKIEPLPKEFTGNEQTLPLAIRDINEIKFDLTDRPLSGFGGVSEYGITVRWDKNFLTMIQLTLARRENFRAYGGIRFGGTLTIEEAWKLGFDHIALATGAGKPTIVPMKNNLIRGVRMASDFLMALQLTGAFKKNSLANLQIRLPVVVIGGGLTAIDTATEAMAYYPVQVEKILKRFEVLASKLGKEILLKKFDTEEQIILNEFLEHGRAIKDERELAKKENRLPNFITLIKSWGGVTVAYRKRLQDSPAYRLNHEEVIKALEEGIFFIENVSPIEAIEDTYSACKAIILEKQKLNPENKWINTNEEIELPARTILVAAGTSPNIIYEKEYPGTFQLDKWKSFFAGFQAFEGEDGKFYPVPTSSPNEPAFFTSYYSEGHLISYYGDNHPKYAGNVVKAMASAKDGYEYVTEIFSKEIEKLSIVDQPERDKNWKNFVLNLDDKLQATVVRVERLTPTIVEILVRAPFAAQHFEPGQFYRLQNYEINSPEINGVKLQLEGLALTGAWVDKEKGLLSMIVLEMGVSSRLCSMLKPGEPVIVMGPTGTPTEIPEGQMVLLAGGGLGNAVLFSIAKALKEKNNRVLYFAGYKQGQDLFKQEEVEKFTDQVIWTSDSGDEIIPNRPQDSYFRGNIVQAMQAYSEGNIGEPLFKFCEIDRLITIGSDRMMNAVKVARKQVFLNQLKEDHIAIGSINSPMQCMMKEICAQCLQKHIDPKTGHETIVFSCFNQDQHLDAVDFGNLSARLRLNTVQEKLSDLWLENVMAATARV